MSISRNFFSSLRWKIALAYLTVIIIGFFITNISIIDIIEKNNLSAKRASFKKYASELADYISKDYGNEDPSIVSNVDNKIQKVGGEIADKENESTRILVLNKDGVVEFDSYNIITGPDSLIRKDLSKVVEDVPLVLKGVNVDPKDYYIEIDNQDKPLRVMYSFAPIQYQTENIIGMVIISTTLSRLDNMLLNMKQKLNYYFLLICIMTIIISLLISEFLTKPIKDLTSAIRKMSSGYFDQRVEFNGTGELKQLGQAFNEMTEKLDNIDKARNEFVSNASHELKTPLSAIKVLVQTLIESKTEDQELIREFLGDINNEIDRLNAIITDLLTIVHMDSGQEQKMKKIDLTQIVKKTVKGLKLLSKKKDIEIIEDIEDNIMIIGSEVKLRQAVSNLLDNAIKYTLEGGSVTIELTRITGHAVLRITDTGIGIPKEALTHIFDRFYRVDKARSRATGGTGLGLAIVRKIIKEHEGIINVQSEESVGSTFVVEVPLA